MVLRTWRTGGRINHRFGDPGDSCSWPLGATKWTKVGRHAYQLVWISLNPIDFLSLPLLVGVAETKLMKTKLTHPVAVCKWTKQWALCVLHKDELCLSVQQYKQDDRMCQSLGESTGHMSGSMLCSSLPCCRGKNNRDGHWWWSQCVWKVPTFTHYMFLSKISVFIITLWLPWAAAVKL